MPDLQRRQRGHQLPRDALRRRVVAVVQQQRELLAADPRSLIQRPSGELCHQLAE